MVVVHLNWLNWFPVLFLEGGLLVVLIDCMISSAIIPRCYKDVYVNSFFPRTARLWNPLPIECCTLNYDLNGLELTPVNCRFFLKTFTVCFNLFVLLFFITPCLVVHVQPYMERIPV